MIGQRTAFFNQHWHTLAGVGSLWVGLGTLRCPCWLAWAPFRFAGVPVGGPLGRRGFPFGWLRLLFGVAWVPVGAPLGWPGFPWGWRGFPLGSRGFPLGCVWVGLGSRWAGLGSLWAPFWVGLGPRWAGLGSLWLPFRLAWVPLVLA